LVSLAIKPLTTAGLSSQAYVDLVQTVGSKLHQLDVSALCLDAAGVDNVVRSCPHVKSLCLGTITGVEQSQLAATLSQRACPLSSLAVGCSEGDARYLLALLANQPPEIALAGTHLKELCLSIETMELATREALLHMLETNASLRYIHIKRRGLAETAPLVVDEQLLAHHQRQLVRKLPVRYALAFLSVLSHAAAVSKPSTSALERFDAGVASEIVGFAGHAVRRRFYCSPWREISGNAVIHNTSNTRRRLVVELFMRELHLKAKERWRHRHLGRDGDGASRDGCTALPMISWYCTHAWETALAQAAGSNHLPWRVAPENFSPMKDGGFMSEEEDLTGLHCIKTADRKAGLLSFEMPGKYALAEGKLVGVS
jgi:hypothetical protein